MHVLPAVHSDFKPGQLSSIAFDLRSEMIELGALKEQLKLLGHGDLPDDQIVNILREMNIDFDLPSATDSSGMFSLVSLHGSLHACHRCMQHRTCHMLHLICPSLLALRTPSHDENF